MNRVSNAYLETVSIPNIGRRRSELLLSLCTAKERAWLATAPLQTIAGQIALKHAVCRLVEDALGAPEVRRNCIEISRSATGGPFISDALALPRSIADFVVERVCVSISHSRETAVGLAVIKGTTHG